MLTAGSPSNPVHWQFAQVVVDGVLKVVLVPELARIAVACQGRCPVSGGLVVGAQWHNHAKCNCGGRMACCTQLVLGAFVAHVADHWENAFVCQVWWCA